MGMRAVNLFKIGHVSWLAAEKRELRIRGEIWGGGRGERMGPKLMGWREGVREDGNKSKESTGGINELKPYHRLVFIWSIDLKLV